MKNKRLNLYFLLLFTASLVIPNLTWAGGATVPSTRSTATLKKYMANFGAMMAGLEIMRLKEKKPDWDVIDLTLKEMSGTLAEMQKADAENAYKEYTDVLSSGLIDLKTKAGGRNKNFYDSLDKIMDTCFKCHAAHRPGDYLTPGKDRMSEYKPLMK